MTRRSLFPMLGVLLLLAAAALLLFGGGDAGEDAALHSGEIEDGVASGDLLRAADGEAPGSATAAPSLAGRDPKHAAAERGPVRVRVLGSGGVPLAGLRVQAVATGKVAEPHAKPLQSHVTDAEGIAVFSDLPYDATLSVRIARTHPKMQWTFYMQKSGTITSVAPGKPVPSQHEAVTGPKTTLRVETGLPLHVDVVSSRRGRRLPAVRWAVQPRFDALDLEQWKEPKRGYPIPAAFGEQVTAKFELSNVRHDHMAADKHHYPFKTHPDARRLLAAVPLRPEARIVVLFDPPADAVGETWHAKQVYMGGERPARVITDASHRRHVKGIPHIPGERFAIYGLMGSWQMSAKGVLPIDPDETLVLHAAMKRVHFETTRVTQTGRGRIATGNGVRLTFQGGKQGGYVVRVGEYGDWIKLYAAKDYAKPKASPRTFDVAVRGLGGEPAAGAEVTIGSTAKTTSPQGIARFENLPHGRHAMKVWGAGASWIQSVDVPKDTSAAVSVRSRLGGTIRVQVVDEDGNPMPFAKLSVTQESGLPWCDVFDRTQRIDPFTGADGRRALHNIEAGKVSITASLGIRKAKADVDVLPARTLLLRLVIK